MSATHLAPERAPSTKILIVDDHPVLRLGLSALIESEPDLAVCGEADTQAGALDAIRELQPDLVVVDLALRGSDGLDLVKDMHTQHPAIPALVLSMHDEAVYAERALRAGARGYVTKQQLDGTVLAAIRRVLDGKLYMSETLQARFAARFVERQAPSDSSPLGDLSDRELQVFRLIGQGVTTRRIANALHLSVKTIETHREHIKHKLTIESGAALVHFATTWVETGRILD